MEMTLRWYGTACDVEKKIKPILENEKIFGANLYAAGMADAVCGYLKEMLAGPGAVRATLKKYVAD